MSGNHQQHEPLTRPELLAPTGGRAQLEALFGPVPTRSTSGWTQASMRVRARPRFDQQRDTLGVYLPPRQQQP